MTQIELYITNYLLSLDIMKELYQEFRLMRKLLFIENEKIESVIELKSFNKLNLLHHLFSRVPRKKLISPNILLNMSIEKYSDYLSENGDDEVIKNLIQCFEQSELKLSSYEKKLDVDEDKIVDKDFYEIKLIFEKFLLI
jgi:preprotein translocase subunit Sec63